MESPAFPNYQQLDSRLPRLAWWVLRGLTLLLVVYVIVLLFIEPHTGLLWTWKILIPLLPLSFALAPGIWRNICPMALLNQLPRTLGFSREKTLSNSMRRIALYVSIVAFVVFVFLRQPLLNQSGFYLGLVFLLALILAFVGGYLYKGRSGWCGTFCPLAPIQKAYGHAPLLLVKNGYCETCLGCQKNCYDFNPRAAIFSDLDDEDSWWSDQRKFFIGLLPGLIVGFFNAGFQVDNGWMAYLLDITPYPLLSLGVFYLLHNGLQLNFFRLASFYALVALSVFYWYGLPVVASGLDELFAIQVPTQIISAAQYTVIVASLAVFARGQLSFHHFRQSRQLTSTATIGKGVKNLRDALEQTGKMTQVHEHSSNRKFLVMPGQSLLDALEANELPVMSGCRMGMCGSDPIVITEGMDDLDPPDENELNTLKRLGLLGKARLACCCQPRAGLGIDLSLDPAQVDVTSVTGVDEDLASEQGLRVVIIGNGIAGISTAEQLREKDESVHITLISEEPYHFYNRMGLEAVIHGKTGLQGLYLMQEEWYERNRIDIWLNTRVSSISPDKHEVALGTQKSLNYDKLVLATGAHAFVPPDPIYQQTGVFTLRHADDALKLRAYVQQNDCRRALVLGGGVLGVEACDALLQLGMKVTLVHTGHTLMDRQLDLQAAVILQKFLQNKGVRIMTGTSIQRIKRIEDQMQVIMANKKQLIIDLVILCIGIRSNIDLAQDAGLQVNLGVVVNEHMQTSNADVYCVGDAAELPGAVGGLWSIGSEQGKVAASSILDEGDVYRVLALPPVQLKVSGIDLKSFGSFEDDEETQSFFDGDIESNCWRHIRVRDGQVVAGVFVNSPQTANAAINASKKRNARYFKQDVLNMFKLDSATKN